MYCGAVADGSVILYHATGTILIRRAKLQLLGTRMAVRKRLCDPFATHGSSKAPMKPPPNSVRR